MESSCLVFSCMENQMRGCDASSYDVLSPPGCQLAVSDNDLLSVSRSSHLTAARRKATVHCRLTVSHAPYTVELAPSVRYSLRKMFQLNPAAERSE